MVNAHGYQLRSKHCNAGDIAEIIPNKLYLGNKNAAKNTEALKQLGITHILNATRNVECHSPHTFSYLRIEIADGDPGIAQYFEKAISFIKTGDVVFVHCVQGISRSASFVIAYLIRTKKWDFETALDFVKKRRPIVAPHFYFQIALSRDAKKLGLLRPR